MRHFLHYKLLGKYKGGHLQTVFFLGLKQWREFFIKIKKIQKYSEITSPLIHDGQWTATLKPNYFKKRMSNSDVTLKVTQSYTFRFKFGF